MSPPFYYVICLSSNLHVRPLIPNYYLNCSQSSIFPSDRQDPRFAPRAAILHECQIFLGAGAPAPSVHLKTKMAAINVKTRYISTISRENRGLWTV